MGLWKLTEIRLCQSEFHYCEQFLRYYFHWIFCFQDMKVGGGVVPRLQCLINILNYLEKQEVVLDLVIDMYIHIDNSTITYIVIEPNVLDLEDPRLIDTPQYLSL